jgi:hypothetical protein
LIERFPKDGVIAEYLLSGLLLILMREFLAESKSLINILNGMASFCSVRAGWMEGCS